jgi:hypothetical protein
MNGCSDFDVKAEVCCKAAMDALAPLSPFGRRVLPFVMTSLHHVLFLGLSVSCFQLYQL